METAYQGIRTAGSILRIGDRPVPPPVNPSQPRTIAEGLEWVRMPIPGPLDHVNLWLLHGADGSTLIDSRQFDHATCAAWSALLDGPLSNRRLTSIVHTHAHSDHAGCSGMLVDRTGADVYFSAAEIEALIARVDPTDEETTNAMAGWLRLCGCPADRHAALVDARLGTRSYFSSRPKRVRTIHDGTNLIIADRTWQVRIYGGHSPGMVTLFDPVRRLLIAGDQVLPAISPLIGNYPLESDPDPLGEYLASLDELAELPKDTLVLPSHGAPFLGLQGRIEELQNHHRARLSAMFDATGDGASVHDVASRIFPQAVTNKAARQALCETQSHLVHLEAKGHVSSKRDAVGTLRFWCL